LRKLSEGQNTVNFEQRFKTSSGAYKTIEWTSSPEPSTGNIFGIGRDVSELRLKDQQLAFSEQMLEQTNEVARVGGWEFDVINQKIHWTSVTREIRGVPPGYDPELLNALNFYEEGAIREKMTNAVNMAIANGEPWDMELQSSMRRGKIFG